MPLASLCRVRSALERRPRHHALSRASDGRFRYSKTASARDAPKSSRRVASMPRRKAVPLDRPHVVVPARVRGVAASGRHPRPTTFAAAAHLGVTGLPCRGRAAIFALAYGTSTIPKSTKSRAAPYVHAPTGSFSRVASRTPSSGSRLSTNRNPAWVAPISVASRHDEVAYPFASHVCRTAQPSPTRSTRSSLRSH